MTEQTLHYTANAVYGGRNYSITIPDNWDCSDEFWQQQAIEKAAADFWYARDGYECDWPLQLEIYRDKARTQLIAKGWVEAENKIEFTAEITED